VARIARGLRDALGIASLIDTPRQPRRCNRAICAANAAGVTYKQRPSGCNASGHFGHVVVHQDWNRHPPAPRASRHRTLCGPGYGRQSRPDGKQKGLCADGTDGTASAQALDRVD